MVPITDRVPFPLFLLQSSTEIGLVYVIMIVMMCRGARAGPEQPHIISAIATAVFFQRNFCFCQRSSQRIQQHLQRWRPCRCSRRRHTCLLFCCFWVVRSKTPHPAFLFRTLLCQRGDWLPPFLAIPHHTMWRQRRQRRSAAAAAARVSPSLRSGVFVRFLVGFGCTKLQLVSSPDYYRLPKGLCRFSIINVVTYKSL